MNDEEREQLHKAVADILEWMVDNEAGPIVENLNAGATSAELAGLEASLGAPLPAALRELYARHDGQPREGDCLFEHMNFLSINRAQDARSGMLFAYFGVRPTGIDQEGIFPAEGSELLEKELTDRWFPFANTEGDFFAVNLDSGRVFRVMKDNPSLTLEAEDLVTFLGDYASRLWDDFYVLAGDPKLEGVTEQGMISLRRYPTEAGGRSSSPKRAAEPARFGIPKADLN